MCNLTRYTKNNLAPCVFDLPFYGRVGVRDTFWAALHSAIYVGLEGQPEKATVIRPFTTLPL